MSQRHTRGSLFIDFVSLRQSISEVPEIEMTNFSKLATILPPEQKAIRAKCFHPTGAFVEFTKDETEQSIPERFEKIVRLHPQRLALKLGDEALSYEALRSEEHTSELQSLAYLVCRLLL